MGRTSARSLQLDSRWPWTPQAKEPPGLGLSAFAAAGGRKFIGSQVYYLGGDWENWGQIGQAGGLPRSAERAGLRQGAPVTTPTWETWDRCSASTPGFTRG